VQQIGSAHQFQWIPPGPARASRSESRLAPQAQFATASLQELVETLAAESLAEWKAYSAMVESPAPG